MNLGSYGPPFLCGAILRSEPIQVLLIFLRSQLSKQSLSLFFQDKEQTRNGIR